MKVKIFNKEVELLKKKLSKEEKEIIKNKVIITGAEIFYEGLGFFK
jgi:hypothetical protein